jgi:hypothetical protein
MSNFCMNSTLSFLFIVQYFRIYETTMSSNCFKNHFINTFFWHFITDFTLQLTLIIHYYGTLKCVFICLFRPCVKLRTWLRKAQLIHSLHNICETTFCTDTHSSHLSLRIYFNFLLLITFDYESWEFIICVKVKNGSGRELISIY